MSRKIQDKNVDFLFEAILNLQTLDECYDFFEDLCTVKELQAMAQRLQVATQLDAGKNYILNIRIVPTYLYVLSDNDEESVLQI